MTNMLVPSPLKPARFEDESPMNLSQISPDFRHKFEPKLQALNLKMMESNNP